MDWLFDSTRHISPGRITKLRFTNKTDAGTGEAGAGCRRKVSGVNGLFGWRSNDGFATSGVELYWQPHLETLAENRDIGFLLGLLAFAGMAAVVLGSVVSGKLSLTVNTEQGRIRVYLAARLTMALAIITAALWLRLPAFCLLYTLYYLVMGCQDTMDVVLLQSNARDEMRGTLMSVQSFALRLGGLVSQLLSAAVLAFLGIPVLWLLLAAVFLLGSGFCGIYYQSRAGKAHKK